MFCASSNCPDAFNKNDDIFKLTSRNGVGIALQSVYPLMLYVPEIPIDPPEYQYKLDHQSKLFQFLVYCNDSFVYLTKYCVSYSEEEIPYGCCVVFQTKYSILSRKNFQQFSVSMCPYFLTSVVVYSSLHFAHAEDAFLPHSI